MPMSEICTPSHMPKMKGLDMVPFPHIKWLLFMFQKCDDIDECSVMARPCNPLRQCTNTQGSYQCGPCPPGYVNNSKTECLLTDPCAAKQHNCDKDTYCINTAVGAFGCQVMHLYPSGDDHLTMYNSPFSLVHIVSCWNVWQWCILHTLCRL